MVRREVFGQQRAGAEILQQELLDISTLYSAGSTQRETAHQRGQSGGVEGKADAGGAGRGSGEARETCAAGVRDDQYVHGTGWADGHRALSSEAGSL